MPELRLDELGKAVSSVLPDTALGADPDLTSPAVVLTVRQAKGLEFDCVLIADPAQILAESPRGLNDLYVALTRATQQVGVVHPGEIPAVLARAGAASGGVDSGAQPGRRPRGRSGALGRGLADGAAGCAGAGVLEAPGGQGEGDFGGDPAGVAGDVEPAVAQGEDAAGGGGVVAADVVPAFVEGVGGAAVEFDDGAGTGRRGGRGRRCGRPGGSGPGGVPAGRPWGCSTSRW